MLVAVRETADSGRLTYLVRDRDGLWWKREMITTESIFGVDLEVDDKGDAHAIWGDYNNGYLYYAVVTAEDGWQTPIVVSANLRDISGEGWTAQIAIDAGGSAHLMWSGTDGEIHYAREGANCSWEHVENVSATSAGSAHDPRFVMSPDGTPRIVWMEGSEWPIKLMYADPLAPTTADFRIEQTVSIPAEMAGPTLSFFYRGQGDLSSTNPFTVELQDGGTTASLFSETAASGKWTHRWVDLSPWTGRTVRLAFNVHQTAGQPAGSVDLDEVTLGAGLHADLWASATSASALPGETITLTLRYGNRGDAEAGSTALTLALPDELEFVSADPPSLTAAPGLSWLPDELAVGSSGTIVVRVTINGEVTAGDVLTTDLAIEPAGGEVAFENNHGAVRVFAGGQRTYLPR